MTEVTRIFDLLELYKSDYSSKEDVFGYKENGEWKKHSAGDYLNFSYKVSSALLKLGITRDDKVATIVNNSPQWNFLDMGLMQIGAINVPVYPTISIENFRFIFNDAEVKLVFISSYEVYQKIEEVIRLTDTLQEVFLMEKVEGIKSFDDFLALADEENYQAVDQIKKNIKPGDLASLIYTSGTTGQPKGVMLSHHNFVTNFLAVSDIIRVNMVGRVMSFLPLCHVYERMLNYMYQNVGISVYYAESIDKLSDNLKEVHPELFCAVPRVLEKSFDKIMAKGRDLKRIKKQLFFWAVNLGYKYQPDHANGWWYHFKLGIADRLIFSKWREALGGELRIVVSGGAALQTRIAKVFWAAKIQVMEGYGLTETSPVIAVSNFKPGGVKFGTVGPVLPGVTVKIAGDGEILCKGPNVMLGYYKRPDLTREVIDEEGWFHTGDIGAFENDKYLRITDRKKEMFKTSGGKYIAPQALENKFKESAFIENIMVVGEHKNFAAAIIVPNFDYLRSWCRVKKEPFKNNQEAIQNKRIVNRIQRAVDEINETLDKIEQIKKFVLLDKPWTVEDGDLSQTLKLKRKELMEKHRELIERIYEGNNNS